MKDRIIVKFVNHQEHYEKDLDIPVNITADELIKSLKLAFSLDIDTTDQKQCYLQMENPIVLLKGDKLLSDFNARNGSTINYTGK